MDYFGDGFGDLAGFQVCSVEHRQTERPIEGSIGDRLLRLGWIAARSKPDPSLVSTIK